MSLTNKLTGKISSELGYDAEKSAVIRYGMFAFFQIFISLAIVAVLGLLLGAVFQALVVSFCSAILRQYSGGVHATKPSICLIVGTVATIAITVIVHSFTAMVPVAYLIGVIVIIMALAYFLIHKYAPVDSPAKPIKTEKKRTKMKRISLIVLSVYFAFIIVLVIMNLTQTRPVYMEYAMCICLASGWQVFNLTNKGHRLLKKVDSVINKSLFKKGEN